MVGRMTALRTISYGGGVQSTALVVLATQGRLDDVVGGPIDAALFANVGDDSEHPTSLSYVRDVATPWAAERGLAVHELHRVTRDGERETLLGRLTTGTQASPAFPVRAANGAPGTRSCTADFKVRVIAKWLKAHGASAENPATVCIGISTDEFERASNKRRAPWENAVYPLLNLGMSRNDCMRLIADAGLPVPGKSSCYFCPFHRPQMWAEMRRDEPTLFWQSVELERTLNRRRDTLGKDRLWLTRFAKPLDEAIGEAQDQLPGFESIGENGCDEGYCWT